MWRHAEQRGLIPIGAGLRGPDGWRASVFATGLKHASAFAFDGEGRLWVTTSAAADHRSDGVYVVARAGARPIRVARVDGPLGLTWYRGRLYVASIGRVTAFGGLHGTRFTTRRTILRGPVAGASNNAIVATSGGRLLMSVSTTCDHCVRHSKWAAAIVSFRPDGSDLRIFARHIRAAYGLALVPGTSAVLATMNQRDDLGARTPGDWLALVRRARTGASPPATGRAALPAPESRSRSQSSTCTRQREASRSQRGSAFVAEWQSRQGPPHPPEAPAAATRGRARPS